MHCMHVYYVLCLINMPRNQLQLAKQSIPSHLLSFHGVVGTGGLDEALKLLSHNLSREGNLVMYTMKL